MARSKKGDSSLERTATRLFPSTADRDAFLGALASDQEFAPCVLQTSPHREGDLHDAGDRLTPGWLPKFARRLADSERPGKHPGHDRGHLYVLDFSSIFAASALLALPGPCERLLDVCAAPGGKTIFAHLALRPGVLISNEVIGKRLGILRYNLKRCGIPGFTLRMDSNVLAQSAPQVFDAVVVDAPCSGQSLLAKGIPNPGCFHKSVVNRNVRRQRRILAESAKTVAPGGYLFYSTCTFALEENERVVSWLLRQRDDFVAVPIGHLAPFQSDHSDFPSYRLYPQSGLGAGAYCALLRRDSNEAGWERPQIAPELLAYPVPTQD